MIVEPTALYVNNSKHGKGFHGNQGGKGGNSKKERPICTYCGIVGHIADKCYKLHAYQLAYKPKGKSSANQVTTGNFGNSMPSNGSSFRNFNSQLVPTKVAEMMNYSHQFNDSQGHFNGTQFPQTHYNGTWFPQTHYNGTMTQIQPQQSQFAAPQCPISQAQCEKLQSFLNS